MSKTDLKIRPLKRKDFSTLKNIIKSLVAKTGETKLLEMVPNNSVETEKESETDNTGAMQSFAMDVLKQCLELLDTEIKVWFADLINVKVEDYDELEITIDIDILNQLIEDKNFIGLFIKGSQVYKKIAGLAGL